MSVSCSSLLQRIHNQRLRDAWLYILTQWGYLSLSFLVLMAFQCPSHVYNAWRGPFPMNMDQFRNHLEMNYNSFGYRSFFSFRWLFFQHEFIQVEFGRSVIDSSAENSFQNSYRQAIYGRVTYTYNRVIEPTIATRYTRLYLKFGSYERSKYQIRHPYQFQSFSINTLQCIVKRLGVLPTEFLNWHDKSMYITRIEDIYNPSPQVLNMALMSKCGIAIGYFYKPRNENFFPGYLYSHHQFNEQVRLFDASCSYTPYVSYVLVGCFVYFLLKNFVRLVQMFMNRFSSLSSIQYPFVVEQLRESDIMSLEHLDNILLNTTYINNHRDHLFIVRDKYLVMLMMHLDEKSPEVLQQFYETAPFIVVPLNTITDVKWDCIVLHNENNSRYIYFPATMNSYDSSAANWLHERLLSLNDEYRYEYVRILAWFLTVKKIRISMSSLLDGNGKKVSIKKKNDIAI